MNKKKFTLEISPIHIWVFTVINLGLIAIVLFLVSPTENKTPQPLPVALESNKQDALLDEDALNAFGKSVLRAGLKNCALPMNQLAERVLIGNKIGGYRFPATDKTFASMSMEVLTKSGGVAYMTFNLSEPGNNGQCIISYEAISQWKDKCSDVVKNVLKDFVYTRKLGQRISILTHKSNENRKIFMMPIASGCLATEKEIITLLKE